MRQAGRWFGSAAWEPLVYIVPFLLYRIVEHAKIRILFEFISLNGVKFRKKNKKLPENLADSEKVCTFAPANRDLAQLVAHTSGGREVAGSSPVIPTKGKSKPLIISSLDFFYALIWRVFGVIVIYWRTFTQFYDICKP